MSEAAPITRQDAVQALYSAIEEAAGLLEVAYAPDDVLRVLNLYGGDLTQAVVAFRVATGAGRAGELDCRFTVPQDVDPYRLAVDNGLLEKTDHPVSRLPADLRDTCPLDGYGLHFGVAGGLKKIWVVLPTGNTMNGNGMFWRARMSTMCMAQATNTVCRRSC